MPELKTYTTPITTYDSFVDKTARDFIGDINRLDTADKSNLVNAINELIHFGNFVISVTGDVDSGYEIDKTGAEITTAIEKKVPIFLLALTDSVSAVLPVSSIEDGKILFSGVLEKDDRTLQNNVSILYSDDSASVDYVSSTNIASENEVEWEDIQNKPFYDESVTSQVSFDPLPMVTFDGAGYTWWKCSDLVLTRAQILDTTILTTFAPGTQFAEVPKETDIVMDEENFTGVLFSSGSSAGYIFCRATGEHTVSFAGNPVTFTCPEMGVYMGFPVGQTPPDTISVGMGYKDVKTLDAKYLPMDAIDERIGAYIEEALGGDY